MNIININPAEYGLEVTKAQEIEAMFKPMLEQMVILEKEANAIFKLPIEQAEIPAKELRLKYVKVRTGTAKIHKELKDFYLKGGRFVDGWKNAQLFASTEIEEKLLSIENYKEIQKAKRIAELQEIRSKELDTYIDTANMKLGELEEAVYQNMKDGIILNFQRQKEAEQKAIDKAYEEKKILDIYNDRKNKLLPYSFYIDVNQLSLTTTEKEFNELLNAGIIKLKKDQDEKALLEKQKKENEAKIESLKNEIEETKISSNSIALQLNESQSDKKKLISLKNQIENSIKLYETIELGKFGTSVVAGLKIMDTKKLEWLNNQIIKMKDEA